MADWDLDDWEAGDPPGLDGWLKENLAVLLDQVTEGRWTSFPSTEGLEWQSVFDSNEPLVTLSPQQFAKALKDRLLLAGTLTGRDTALLPHLREELVREWHKMRCAWGEALDEVSREAERLLALPVQA